MLHLVSNIPYTHTMCGLSVGDIGEDWTDDVIAVANDPTHFDACSKCVAETLKDSSNNDYGSYRPL